MLLTISWIQLCRGFQISILPFPRPTANRTSEAVVFVEELVVNDNEVIALGL